MRAELRPIPSERQINLTCLERGIRAAVPRPERALRASAPHPQCGRTSRLARIASRGIFADGRSSALPFATGGSRELEWSGLPLLHPYRGRDSPPTYRRP